MSADLNIQIFLICRSQVEQYLDYDRNLPFKKKILKNISIEKNQSTNNYRASVNVLYTNCLLCIPIVSAALLKNKNIRNVMALVFISSMIFKTMFQSIYFFKVLSISFCVLKHKIIRNEKV